MRLIIIRILQRHPISDCILLQMLGLQIDRVGLHPCGAVIRVLFPFQRYRCSQHHPNWLPSEYWSNRWSRTRIIRRHPTFASILIWVSHSVYKSISVLPSNVCMQTYAKFRVEFDRVCLHPYDDIFQRVATIPTTQMLLATPKPIAIRILER